MSWALGGGSGSAHNGEVFDVLLAGRVVDPAAGQSVDVKGNLMKLSFVNTAGQSFPLRDEVEFTWGEPQLTLTEGIRDIGDVPGGGNPANTDGGTVQAGDVVTVRIDVTNSGTRDAVNTTVWERLPTGTALVDCAAVSNISNGGACSLGIVSWTGLESRPIWRSRPTQRSR